ncbi:MAG: DUF1499 domain-containing protein [Deltaproteobacteria bacterium]
MEDKPDYLRVELRTTFFVDDREFLLDRSSRFIHVRSASRLGVLVKHFRSLIPDTERGRSFPVHPRVV